MRSHSRAEGPSETEGASARRGVTIRRARRYGPVVSTCVGIGIGTLQSELLGADGEPVRDGAINGDGGALDIFDLLAGLRPAWQADAACREHPELRWFSHQSVHQREAKAICRGCLVLDECRSWAMAQGSDLVGVWGGLSTSERRRLRRSAA